MKSSGLQPWVQRIGVLRPPDLLDRNADRHPRSVGNRTSVGQRRGTPRSAQTVVRLLHRPAGCRRRRSELRMIAALLRIVHVAPLRDVSRLVDLQDDAHDRRDRVRRNLLLDGNLLDRGGHARHKDPDHRTVECGRRHLRLREDRSRSGRWAGRTSGKKAYRLFGVEAARTIYRLYNHVRCIVERGPKRRADKRCMQRIDVAVSIRQEK